MQTIKKIFLFLSISCLSIATSQANQTNDDLQSNHPSLRPTLTKTSQQFPLKMKTGFDLVQKTPKELHQNMLQEFNERYHTLFEHVTQHYQDIALSEIRKVLPGEIVNALHPLMILSSAIQSSDDNHQLAIKLFHLGLTVLNSSPEALTLVDYKRPNSPSLEDINLEMGLRNNLRERTSSIIFLYSGMKFMKSGEQQENPQLQLDNYLSATQIFMSAMTRSPNNSGQEKFMNTKAKEALTATIQALIYHPELGNKELYDRIRVAAAVLNGEVPKHDFHNLWLSLRKQDI